MAEIAKTAPIIVSDETREMMAGFSPNFNRVVLGVNNNTANSEEVLSVTQHLLALKSRIDELEARIKKNEEDGAARDLKIKNIQDRQLEIDIILERFKTFLDTYEARMKSEDAEKRLKDEAKKKEKKDKEDRKAAEKLDRDAKEKAKEAKEAAEKLEREEKERAKEAKEAADKLEREEKDRAKEVRKEAEKRERVEKEAAEKRERVEKEAAEKREREAKELRKEAEKREREEKEKAKEEKEKAEKRERDLKFEEWAKKFEENSKAPVNKRLATVTRTYSSSSDSDSGAMRTRSQSREARRESPKESTRQRMLEYAASVPAPIPKKIVQQNVQPPAPAPKKLNKSADDKSKKKIRKKLNKTSEEKQEKPANDNDDDDKVEKDVPRRKPGRRSLKPWPFTPFNLPPVSIEEAEVAEDRRRGFWPRKPSEIGRSHPRRFDPTTKDLICLCGGVLSCAGLSEKEIGKRYHSIREVGSLHFECHRALASETKDKLLIERTREKKLLEEYARDKRATIDKYGIHIEMIVEIFMRQNEELGRREFDLDFFLNTRTFGHAP